MHSTREKIPWSESPRHLDVDPRRQSHVAALPNPRLSSVMLSSTRCGKAFFLLVEMAAAFGV